MSYSLFQTRCDGTQPSCKTCEVYNDECRYEKPPPMSQIIAMANRLQEAEQTILRLKGALEAASPPTVQQTASANPSASSVSETQPERMDNRTRHQDQILSKEPTSEELLSDLSLDEYGKVSNSTTSHLLSYDYAPVFIHIFGIDILLRTHISDL